MPVVSNIQGDGSPNAQIAIVGDFASAFDMNARKPFSGPAGTILEQCLHAAGLIRGECYITNLIKVRPMRTVGKKGNEYVTFDTKGRGTFNERGMAFVDELRGELDQCGANIIVACGDAAFLALTGLNKLSKYRGYIFRSQGLKEERKVIGTHHPSSSLRGMYTYRHMMVSDMQKAKGESGFRELIRPDRKLIYDFPTVEDALQWLEYFETVNIVSVDIEVLNYEVSCISFSADPDIAISMPITDRWELEEEAMIWKAIQRILGNPRSAKVFQNGIFDIHFLMTRNGIVVRGPIHDTMIAHSIMYPDLPKGLGFLGSIYCGSQEYWKDTVSFTNIKEDS
jgi:uracil-DNA glycosylase family 4